MREVLAILLGTNALFLPDASGPVRAGDREQFLGMKQLKGAGTFKISTETGHPPCWLSEKDSDTSFAPQNIVDIDFAVRANTRYRCWVYVGGCCVETMSFYYQGSDLTVRSPRDAGKQLSIEPGSRCADSARIAIPGLEKTHQGGPKEPSHWEWIEIPLREFARPGEKKVRLLTDQKGFAVACAVVSSMRSSPPTPEELKKLGKP